LDIEGVTVLRAQWYVLFKLLVKCYFDRSSKEELLEK
jgi:hypothetical protein